MKGMKYSIEKEEQKEEEMDMNGPLIFVLRYAETYIATWVVCLHRSLYSVAAIIRSPRRDVHDVEIKRCR